MLKLCWSWDLKPSRTRQIWGPDLKIQAISCQTIKVYRQGAYEPAEAGKRAGGELWERQMPQRNAEHSYYCLNALLLELASCFVSRFLNKFNMSDNNSNRGKNIEVAQMLRQYSIARDMSHGHGIMSSDRGIQAVWPLRLSQGTWALNFDPSEALSKVWYHPSPQRVICYFDVWSGSHVGSQILLQLMNAGACN